MNSCAEIASPQQPQRGCQISNNNPVAIFSSYVTLAFINLPGKVMSDGGYKIRNQAAIHFITFRCRVGGCVYKKTVPGYSFRKYPPLSAGKRFAVT